MTNTEERTLRLECLKLAHHDGTDWCGVNMEAAQEYVNFVFGTGDKGIVRTPHVVAEKS